MRRQKRGKKANSSNLDKNSKFAKEECLGRGKRAVTLYIPEKKIGARGREASASQQWEERA